MATDKTSHLGQNFFKEGFAKSFNGFGGGNVFFSERVVFARQCSPNRKRKKL